MLTKNEKLTLAYTAFDLQLKSARKALEIHFKAPLADWVDGLKSRCREVDEKVKIFRPRIEAVAATTGLDDDRVAVDFRKAVLAGKFNQAELLQMLEAGMLVPTVQTEEAIRLLHLKGGKARSAYTVQIPKVDAGWKQELRTLPLHKGAFEGLEESLKRTVDIEGTIVKTAEAIETVPIDAFSGRQPTEVALGARARRSRRA